MLEKECYCNCQDPIGSFFVFYEAQKVKAGTLGGFPLAEDTADFSVSSNACGVRGTFGTWKFFCEDATGDLSTKWKKNLVHPPYSRMLSHCGRNMSGGFLSADGDDAARHFWGGTPEEGPAFRFAGVVFNCCRGNERKWAFALPWYPSENFGEGPLPLPSVPEG